MSEQTPATTEELKRREIEARRKQIQDDMAKADQSNAEILATLNKKQADFNAIHSDTEKTPITPPTAIATLAKTKKEVEKEIGELFPKDREKIQGGLSVIGFRAEKLKSDILAAVFHGILITSGSKGDFGKFCKNTRDSLIKNGNDAIKKANDPSVFKDAKIAKVVKGKTFGVTLSGKTQRTLSNIGGVTSNILKYGRLAADAFGWTAGAANRLIMTAGMATAFMAEKGKETRLQNEDVIERTRIQNAEKAAEEAWKIYEKAGGKIGEVEEVKENGEIRYKYKDGTSQNLSVEDLKKGYLMQMPEDLRARLDRAFLEDMPQDLQEKLKDSRTATLWLGKLAKKDINKAMGWLEGALKKIENNPKLSTSEKEAKKEKLLRGQEASLKDWDQIITQYGTADGIAMALRYAQTAGKTAVRVTQIQSLVLGVGTLWKGISNILHNHEHALTSYSKNILATRESKVNLPKPLGKASRGVQQPKPANIVNTDQPNSGLKKELTKPKGVDSKLTTSSPKVTTQDLSNTTDTTTNTPDTLPQNAEGIPKESIIGKNEGIEHALKRQIIANPELAEKLGFEKGMDINKFANGAAHRVALNHGYVDKFTGEEIRVRGGAGEVAYQIKLDENGEIKIQEFKIKDGKFSVSDDLHGKDSQFEGGKEEKYEYRSSGKKVPTKNIIDTTGKTPETASAPVETKALVAEPIAPKITEPVPEKITPVEPTPKTTPVDTQPTLSREEVVRADLDRHYQVADNANTLRMGTEIGVGGNPTPGGNPSYGRNVIFNERGIIEQSGGDGLRYFYPDLTQKENITLNNLFGAHPEFGGNPYRLSGRELLATYDMHVENIRHVIPNNTETAWAGIKNFSAKEMLSANLTNTDGSQDPFINYLQKLQAISGEKPRGRIPFWREAETNQQYEARALQKIIKLGRTAELKASI